MENDRVIWENDLPELFEVEDMPRLHKHFHGDHMRSVSLMRQLLAAVKA